MSTIGATTSSAIQHLPQQHLKEATVRLDQAQDLNSTSSDTATLTNVSEPASNGANGEASLESFVASFKQDRIVQAQPKDPALQEAESKVQATLTTLASDADGFHAMFKQIYGERYQPNTVEALRNQVLAGDFSSIPDIKVVSGDTLHGNHAAYGDGTIFLNEALLQDTDKAAAYIIEELGHHYDGLFGAGDAKGDEGEMLRAMTSGQPVSANDMQRMRTESDKGVIEVDGKQIEVEFGWASKAFKKVKNAVSDVAKKVRDEVKDFGDAALDVVKLQARLLTFPADYVLNGDDAVDRLEKSGKEALKSVLESEVFSSVAIAAVTLASGGGLTGPLLIAQQAAQQGVAAALKTAAVSYVKSEVADLVAGKIAKETGSEWLGTAAGAFLKGSNNSDGLGSNLQSGIDKLSNEQVQSYIKPEIFDIAGTDVLKNVESKVDFSSLGEKLGNWAEQGADWDKLTAATSSLDRKLGDSVKDIDWPKLLEKSKASAEALASKAVDLTSTAKSDLQPLGNSMKSSVRSGFDLAKLPEMIEKASDSGLKELSKIAADRINKDVSFAPLREKLTGWAKAGADTGGLIDLMKSAPAEIGKAADDFSWEAMYGKTAASLKSQALEQIDARVDYAPLQDGLNTWIENGAKIDDLGKLFDTVKDGVDADVTKGLARFDEANVKAGEVFNRIASKSGEMFSMDMLQNVLTALDGKQSGAADSQKPQDLSTVMSKLGDTFTNRIQAQMMAGIEQLNDPAVGAALSSWVAQGAKPDQLGSALQLSTGASVANGSGVAGPDLQGLQSASMKAALTADILGSIDTGSLRESIGKIREAGTTLGDISARVAEFADELPNAGYAELLKEIMEDITPQLAELLNKGETYLNTVDDVKHNNESRAQQLNHVLQKSA
ncbi:hypothetical protein [Allohahella sp. A8]|uniref:hypothetical protein n=1 Tax=Allohahella sp. A8 TaxID=3141461 RepID=UPI003A80CA90